MNIFHKGRPPQSRWAWQPLCAALLNSDHKALPCCLHLTPLTMALYPPCLFTPEMWQQPQLLALQPCLHRGPWGGAGAPHSEHCTEPVGAGQAPGCPVQGLLGIPLEKLSPSSQHHPASTALDYHKLWLVFRHTRVSEDKPQPEQLKYQKYIYFFAQPRQVVGKSFSIFCLLKD